MRGPWFVNKISYLISCRIHKHAKSVIPFFFLLCLFLFFLTNQPTFLFANRLYWYQMVAEIEVNSHFLFFFLMSYHCHLLYNGFMYNVKIPWYSNKQQTWCIMSVLSSLSVLGMQIKGPILPIKSSHPRSIRRTA